jgi:hypothetical protein
VALAYLILLLLPLAAVGYIVWDHKRKRAQREAVSTGRMHELLGAAAHAPPPAPPVQPEIAVTPATEKPPAPVAAYTLRERLLSPPQTLLYFLLKTTLPEHLVFAQTTVASVLEAGPGLAAYAREEQARTFSRHLIDFVITDRSTHPLCAVTLVSAADPQHAVLAFLRIWFAAAGIRFVEIDSAALPRREDVRAVVLGDEQHESAHVNESRISE